MLTDRDGSKGKLFHYCRVGWGDMLLFCRASFAAVRGIQTVGIVWGLFCTVVSSVLVVSGTRASGLPGWPPAPGRIAERGLGKRSTRSGLALLPIRRPVIAGHTSPGSLNYATPPKLLTLPCFPSAPVAPTGSVEILDEGFGEPFNRVSRGGEAPALGVGRH